VAFVQHMTSDEVRRNFVTTEVAALRTAGLIRGRIPILRLAVNRVQPCLLRRLNTTPPWA